MASVPTTASTASGDRIALALREAVYAGLISLGLFVLFVGLKSEQNISNELILTQRWGLLAIFVIVAAVGRFFVVAYVQPWSKARKAEKSARATPTEVKPSFFKRNLSRIAIVALILYPPVILALVGVQGSLKWVDNFGVQILIYVMLAWG